MALDLMKTKGTPLERQKFTWRIVQPTISKLDDDTRGQTSSSTRSSSRRGAKAKN